MQRLVIPGRLDAMNDLVSANRTNRFKGAKMKRDNQDAVLNAIKSSSLKPIEGRVRATFIWYEPNRKRDPDNVSSACKFIFDALQEAGIIKGDSQRYVAWPIVHEGFIDKDNPRVEVLLKEVQ